VTNAYFLHASAILGCCVVLWFVVLTIAVKCRLTSRVTKSQTGLMSQHNQRRSRSTIHSQNLPCIQPYHKQTNVMMMWW